MELLGRQLQAKHRLLRPSEVWTARCGFPHHRLVQQPPLAILAAAVLVIFGPVVLLTIARTSVLWIQIVLGLCRTCFPLFRIFGV
jgi:hypothetical protein